MRTTRAIDPDQTNVGIFNQDSARRGVELTAFKEWLPFSDEERQIRSSGNREPTAVGEAEASLNQEDVPDTQAGIGKCDREDQAFFSREGNRNTPGADQDGLVDRQPGVVDTKEEIASSLKTAKGNIKRPLHCSRNSIGGDHESSGAIDQAGSLAIHHHLCSDIKESQSSDVSDLIKGEATTEASVWEIVDGQAGIENLNSQVRSGRKSEGAGPFRPENEFVGDGIRAGVDLDSNRFGGESHPRNRHVDALNTETTGHALGVDQEGSEATGDRNKISRAIPQSQEGIGDIDSDRTIGILFKDKVPTQSLAGDIKIHTCSRNLEVRTSRKNHRLRSSKDFVAFINGLPSGVDAQSEVPFRRNVRNVDRQRAFNLGRQAFGKDEEVTTSFTQGDEIGRSIPKRGADISETQKQNLNIIGAIVRSIVPVRTEPADRQISAKTLSGHFDHHVHRFDQRISASDSSHLTVVKIDRHRLIGSGNANRLADFLGEGVNADANRSGESEISDSDHLDCSIRFESIKRTTRGIDFHQTESGVVNEKSAGEGVDFAIIEGGRTFPDKEGQLCSGRNLTTAAVHEGDVALDRDNVSDVDRCPHQSDAEELGFGITEEDPHAIAADLNLFIDGRSGVVEAKDQCASGIQSGNRSLQSAAQASRNAGVGDNDGSFAIDQPSTAAIDIDGRVHSGCGNPCPRSNLVEEEVSGHGRRSISGSGQTSQSQGDIKNRHPHKGTGREGLGLRPATKIHIAGHFHRAGIQLDIGFTHRE